MKDGPAPHRVAIPIHQTRNPAPSAWKNRSRRTAGLASTFFPTLSSLLSLDKPVVAVMFMFETVYFR